MSGKRFGIEDYFLFFLTSVCILSHLFFYVFGLGFGEGKTKEEGQPLWYKIGQI
jgi:hypothetical protein